MDAANDRIARRIVVHGRVQGVWFRAWTRGEAQALGLDGWVRNRADGTVELVAAGPAARVALLIERCRRGPPAARVDRVDVADAADAVDPGFTQRPTG